MLDSSWNELYEMFVSGDKEEQEEILKELDMEYRNGTPITSDMQYDTLLDIYNATRNTKWSMIFEPDLGEGWVKEEHVIKMGSLDKVNTEEELRKWYSKLSKGTNQNAVITDKCDGISLALTYYNGKLTKAVTRGDGIVGENIYDNVIWMKGIPKVIEEWFNGEIRGELVIKAQDFSHECFKDFANSRNAVAGIARRYRDRNYDQLKRISFIAYDVEIYDEAK